MSYMEFGGSAVDPWLDDVTATPVWPPPSTALGASVIPPPPSTALGASVIPPPPSTSW